MQYLSWLRNDYRTSFGNPLSAKSIKHHYNILKMIFRYAELQEVINKNPMLKVPVPRLDKKKVDALSEEDVKIFIEAGCIVSTPTCGPCLGGYMGILAAGERAVATTNRNFVGRMGHVTSEVYLASPAVAAASAIAGKIADPSKI